MVNVASELNNAGYCVCYSIELYFVVQTTLLGFFIFLVQKVYLPQCKRILWWLHRHDHHHHDRYYEMIVSLVWSNEDMRSQQLQTDRGANIELIPALPVHNITSDALQLQHTCILCAHLCVQSNMQSTEHEEKDRAANIQLQVHQGGITCEAIDEHRISSYAIGEHVIINFCDKNVVIARFCDKNVVIARFATKMS